MSFWLEAFFDRIDCSFSTNDWVFSLLRELARYGSVVALRFKAAIESTFLVRCGRLAQNDRDCRSILHQIRLRLFVAVGSLLTGIEIVEAMWATGDEAKAD